MPHERQPSSAKCTMPSPHAHRHLRNATGIAAMRTYGHVGSAAVSGSGPEEAAETSSSTTSTAAAFSGRPTGGKLRVRLDASGITSGAVPPVETQGLAVATSSVQGEAVQPAATTQTVPILDIRVEGRALHAPLIERLIELPMDINDGRVSVAGIVEGLLGCKGLTCFRHTASMRCNACHL